ncbi:hypothetical protein TrRE_jg4626 [Triparma retinervis]|uniref:Thioesterase domain-containing protein n=1 Tax=Triparma retinervis TaxID=2557542 RepID=A0A9W7DPZ8_9STRA|nr:hypothetical protein TrRE_jg4626 [Triparma retinervis]
MANGDEDKVDFGGFIHAKSVGPILASTSCKYKFPVEFPDDLVACSRIPMDSVEEDRFTMKYMVWSKTHGRVAAEGDGVIVMYDYENGKKSSVNEGLRAAIKRIEDRL